MGQPIFLKKGGETMTVYGRNQATVHVGEGWQLVDETISLPIAPAAVVESKPVAKKPAAKRIAKKGKG